VNPVRRFAAALREMRWSHVVIELALLVGGILIALAYRALRNGVLPEERDAVAAALGQLTSRRTLRLGRATYTDLLSTGNLRLIRNADLRDRIVRL
jgi:hypothetical protein